LSNFPKSVILNSMRQCGLAPILIILLIAAATFGYLIYSGKINLPQKQTNQNSTTQVQVRQSDQGSRSQFKMPPLAFSDWVNNQIVSGSVKPVSKITISPNSGPFGSTISVTGTNWPPNKKIILSFVGLNMITDTLPIGSAIIDANGILPPTSITLGDSSAKFFKMQNGDLVIVAIPSDSNPQKSPYWAAALFTNTNNK